MARTRQPQGPVRPVPGWNWVVNFNAGSASPELISSARGTTGGSPISASYADGVGIKFASASSQYWQGPVAGMPTTFPITFVTSFVVNSLSVAARIFTSGMASNYAGLYFWVSPTGTVELGYGNNTSNSTGTGNCYLSTATGSVVVGKKCSLAAVVKSGSIECWLNGVRVSTEAVNGTATTIVTVGSPLVGRLDYSSGSYYSDATVGLVALGNTDTPSGQLSGLSLNPWQLFAPPRRIWVQLGAASGTGATTYTVTGSGTVVFSGTPAYKRLVKTITSGGITYTGAGAAKDIHSPDTSGGISYTGTAVAKKLFAPLSSGGIIFAGDAVEKLIRSALAAGGLLFGGTAGFIPVLSGGTIYTVTPSGGIVFGSSAAVKSIHDSLSQGGLAYSGIAGYNLIREILAAGGLTFAGVAGVTGPSTGTGSLDQATIDAIALAVWQRVVDAGLTAEQLLRLLVSHAAGSATGLENGAPVFKSLDGTKDRITGTYAAGTRTVTGRDAT